LSGHNAFELLQSYDSVTQGNIMNLRHYENIEFIEILKMNA